MLERGVIIDGRFEVEAHLGEGGLAQVYRVRHTELGSIHALKLLSWKKKSLNERLLLEGRIQAQLDHPNIVSVTDIVRHEGQLGLLMEFVDHQSLEEYLGTHGSLGLERGLELFAPILSAVAAAHELGVTHRDLKPANVLLASSSRGLIPKVTDFGIAKVVAEATGHSTAVGSTMGTPGYLAPEQMVDSSSTDARADIFALGAICWELISGRRAFADEQGNLTVLATTQREVAPLSDFNIACPNHIETALLRAMEKDPSARFQSCAAFAEVLLRDHPKLLREVQGNTSNTSALSLSGVSSTLKGATPPDGNVPRIERKEGVGKGKAPTAVIVMVALSLFGGGMAVVGLIGWLSTRQPEPIATPQAPPAEVAVPQVRAAPKVAPLKPPPKLEDVPVPAMPPPVVSPEPRAVLLPEPVIVAVIAPSAGGGEEAAKVGPFGSVLDETVQTPTPEVVEVTLPSPPTEVSPEPDPVVVAPTPSIPNVGGEWTGKAARRPIELRLQMGEDGALTGGVIFTVGLSPREEPLMGRVEAGGSLRFSASGLDFSGRVDGDKMSGTYKKSGSGKTSPWMVQR